MFHVEPTNMTVSKMSDEDKSCNKQVLPGKTKPLRRGFGRIGSLLKRLATCYSYLWLFICEMLVIIEEKALKSNR